MRASVITTVAASALAAAAPPAAPPAKGHFSVTDFVFGCNVGCSWSFKVAVGPSFQHHPAVTTPVTCAGSYEDKDYKACGKINDQLSILAYIESASGKLKLKYVVEEAKPRMNSHWTGEKAVYAVTSPKASLQKPNFTVDESNMTGVA